MVVGDAGSIYGIHRASDYTVLGDEVNLAARLESANKVFGSKILMNERTAACCGDQFLLRPMGTLRVVGKVEGVLTFEALATVNDATESQRAIAALSTTVVEHYRLADFVACLKCAKELEQQFGSTKFEKLYIDLCKRHSEHPPDGAFDATISLTDK
jgi:adenylate cyclase